MCETIVALIKTIDAGTVSDPNRMVGVLQDAGNKISGQRVFVIVCMTKISTANTVK
jgi:hypothetical protein